MEHSVLCLVTIMQEWGASNMSVKECIDFAVLASGSANAAVRTAANQLFAEMYKHMGEGIRNFITDIKESTQKVIDAEFGKVTPYKKGEFVSQRVP